MIGVEVGGAVKNVLAIAAGISDGLKFGANTRIALINRGLTEMTRLGVALGANAETFMGLSGMGDLVLTCTDDQSRNRRVGLLMAAGRTRDEATREIGLVWKACTPPWRCARWPSGTASTCPSAQVYGILYEDLAPQDAVMALMSRTLKPETVTRAFRFAAQARVGQAPPSNAAGARLRRSRLRQHWTGSDCGYRRASGYAAAARARAAPGLQAAGRWSPGPAEIRRRAHSHTGIALAPRVESANSRLPASAARQAARLSCSVTCVISW